MLPDICTYICHCHSTPKRILPNCLFIMQERVAANRKDKAPILVEYLICLEIMLRDHGTSISVGNWMTCSGLDTL